MKELTELQDINHNLQGLTFKKVYEENDSNYCITYDNKTKIFNNTEIAKYFIR
mgnify:CR=1 FL=1